MFEKWQDMNETKKIFGAHLTDLSKVADCLSRELIVKLNAYGFSLPSYNVFTIIYQIHIKELSLIILIVNGRNLYLLYFKVQYLDLYYSKSF